MFLRRVGVVLFCMSGIAASGCGGDASGVSLDSSAVDGAVSGDAQADATGPNQTLTLFTASPSLVASFFDRDDSTGINNLHRYSAVVTDLTVGTADGWTETSSALIGTGSAVHFAWHHNQTGQLSTSPQTVAIRNATENGVCKAGLNPRTEPSANIDGGYATFFAWSGARETLVACGVAGTVTAVREPGPDARVRLSFNVQFNDGTAWIDKVFYAQYRHD